MGYLLYISCVVFILNKWSLILHKQNAPYLCFAIQANELSVIRPYGDRLSDICSWSQVYFSFNLGSNLPQLMSFVTLRLKECDYIDWYTLLYIISYTFILKWQRIDVNCLTRMKVILISDCLDLTLDMIIIIFFYFILD